MPAPIDQLVHKIREITHQLEVLEATFEQLAPAEGLNFSKRPILPTRGKR